MNNYFLVKVKREKTLETGAVKKVTEQYLVDAVNFTDAENRAFDHVASFAQGDIEVNAIKKEPISEIYVGADEERWYKAVLTYIIMDERTGAGKKTQSVTYVQAKDILEAVNKINEQMKDTMTDWEIASVAETAVVEFLPYETTTKEGEAE